MNLRKSLILVIVHLTAYCGFAGTGQLYLLEQYLGGEQITDMCVWKNSIWASTSTGLYQIKEDKVVEIPLSIKENDRITSLHNGSPYTLICGTFEGDLVFVTQDQSDYCQAVWSLKEEGNTPSFYVNSVSQNSEGIWLGTLEHGIYLYRPELDSLQNFSLDFNEEDSLGLNVYDVYKDEHEKTWVIAQDGLYLIMNIFGKKGELQYVKSNKVKYRPIELDFTGERSYIAFKKKNRYFLGRANCNRNAFDIRIRDRKRLPTEDIRAIEVNNSDDFWLLSSQLHRSKSDAWISYPLRNEELETIDPIDLVVHGGYIWVSSKKNGLLKYSLEPEIDKDEELAENFALSNINFDRTMELNLVYFSPGDSALLSASHSQLNELANYLLQDSIVHIELHGHTAKDGKSSYLVNLSGARARSVRSFLLEKGIPNSRIKVVGKGASELKVPESPKSPKNRRVEIILSR